MKPIQSVHARSEALSVSELDEGFTNLRYIDNTTKELLVVNRFLVSLIKFRLCLRLHSYENTGDKLPFGII